MSGAVAPGSLSSAVSSMTKGINTMLRALHSASATSSSFKSDIPSVSEEEKAVKREAMRKAADQRSAQWDRKLGTGSGNSAKKASSAANNSTSLHDTGATVPEHNHPETLRAMEQTKRGEAHIEQVRQHASHAGCCCCCCLCAALF